MSFNFIRRFLGEQDPNQQQPDIGHLLGGAQDQPQTQPQQDPQQQPADDMGSLLGDQNPGSGDVQDDQGLDNLLQTAAEQDPDKQGLIRTVDKAHLVFKRQTEEGTYEELWIYNVGKLQDELEIRKAILAGTDIAPSQKRSPDGDQSYDIWSAGNAELLHIKGLPN